MEGKKTKYYYKYIYIYIYYISYIYIEMVIQRCKHWILMFPVTLCNTTNCFHIFLIVSELYRPFFYPPIYPLRYKLNILLLKGGDMANSVGGGQKVLMLRKEMELHKDDPKKIIMFTDSYDVVFNANEEKILEQFLQFNARVLFSAEGFCWPDPNLASK
jgi:hypothetical protein